MWWLSADSGTKVAAACKSEDYNKNVRIATLQKTAHDCRLWPEVEMVTGNGKFFEYSSSYHRSNSYSCTWVLVAALPLTWAGLLWSRLHHHSHHDAFLQTLLSIWLNSSFVVPEKWHCHCRTRCFVTYLLTAWRRENIVSAISTYYHTIHFPVFNIFILIVFGLPNFNKLGNAKLAYWRFNKYPAAFFRLPNDPRYLRDNQSIATLDRT